MSRQPVSYWETVPLDILMSELSYLDLENPEVLRALCGDSAINSRLQCDDPNGLIWKYLYTHKLSRILPSESTLSLKDQYNRYLATIPYGMSEMLYNATFRGYEILVEKVVKNGADIHERGDRALQIAAENGRLDIVEFLVDHGANIDANDNMALRDAVRSGHLNVVKYLVEHGANVNGRWILESAASNGFFDIVKYLINHGAQVDAYDDAALLAASQNGHLDIVKYLVAHGANVGTNDGRALRKALRYRHPEVAKYLASVLFNLH